MKVILPAPNVDSYFVVQLVQHYGQAKIIGILIYFKVGFTFQTFI